MRHLPAKAALLLCCLVAIQSVSRAQIQILSVTSSANFSPGLLKPGSLASIFCTGLQDIPDSLTAQGYPLPASLAGVTVTVNGVSAPMLALASMAEGAYQQINIQVPWEVNNSSGLIFNVSQQGDSAHFTTYPSYQWPVFFTDSSGYAVAQHSNDYRPVTPKNPARTGEWIVVYATNLGPVQNQPPDGYPAGPNVLAPILPDPSPFLYYYGLVARPSEGYAALHIESNYIGIQPGAILYQVNLQIPTRQPEGDLVFGFVDIYDCGFFFRLGCGRGFVTVAESMPAKIPVTN